MLNLFFTKAYAALPGETNSLLTKIKKEIISPIIYLLIALAVVYFFWGMVEFIQNADNPSKRKEGFDHMLWGILGIVLMFSVKGVIAIISGTVNQ